MTDGRRVSATAALLASLILAACQGESRPPAEPAEAAHIRVAESGPTRITATELEAAGLGWRDIDPGLLRLYEAGRPVAARILPDRRSGGFRIDFYAGAVAERYDGRRHYLLTRGADRPAWMGPRGLDPQGAGDAKRAPEAPALAAGRSHASLRITPRTRYEPQRVGDPWLGDMLAAPDGESRIELAVTGLAQGPARLQLRLWSTTEAPQDPDHRLTVSINGQPLGSVAWDGKGEHRSSLDLPAGLLREGSNTLTLAATGVPEVRADVSYLDALQLDYPRLAEAREDRLALTAGGESLAFDGFEGPVDAFEIDAAGRARWLLDSATDQGLERRIETLPGRQYLILGSEGWGRAEAITAAVAKPDLRAAPGADWLAIADDDLAPALAPLVAARQAQGLSTLVVPSEAVFDQFGQGAPEPEAIRAFLAHAALAWATPPRYLLLVGDMSYDPWGQQAPAEANRLPTFFVDTVFGGSTASDSLLTDLDDDGLPDLPIGRAPARAPAEVETFVAKTLAYEASGGDWQRRVVTVADGSEPSFANEAADFLERFPAGYSGLAISPAAGDAGTPARIAEALGEGVGLLAYFGHGSIEQWGGDALLTVADVAALRHPEHLPIVTNWTCLTGLFTHPEARSMAEALLWQVDGGAVAVLAPTSLTLGGEQRQLATALAEALADPAVERLGDAVLGSWRAVPQTSDSSRDVMRTFLLFGDPALRLGP